MKKVLCFSRDPGAANVIIPTVKALRGDPSITVVLYGKDVALKKYREYDLVSLDIAKEVQHITLASLCAFITRESFDVVVTGTTSNDVTDRLLWQAAHAVGVPTVVILDQWLNYRARFCWEPVGVRCAGGDLIMPDAICVMDDFAKMEMVRDGLPEDRLVVTGHPYLEDVRIQTTSPSSRRAVLQKYGIALDSAVITFASEPLAESFPDALHYGYNQYTILDTLTCALDTVAQRLGKPVALVVRPHPRDSREHFVSYQRDSDVIKVVLDDDANLRELMYSSDVVTGMSSMFLLEAMVLHKPVISIQIGLNRDDPFMPARRGLTRTVTKQESLADTLISALTRPSEYVYDLPLIPHAAEGVAACIRKYLKI